MAGQAATPGFDQWFLARRSALLRSAWLLTGDRENAEDLMQTALARCWPRWARISRMSNPDAYVQRVLTNTYLSSRGRRWHREVPTADLPDRPAGGSTGDDRDVLLAALATLPRRQRATVVLRFAEDLSEAQTAELLGCSVGTVKSQTARALHTLRADVRLVEGREPA